MASRKTVGLLLDYLAGDYQAGLLEGVSALAEERDLNLLVVVGRALSAPRPADAAQNEIYGRLGPASVDGLVVGAGSIGIYAGVDRLTELCRRYAPLPVVSVGASLPGIPSFVISNRRGMRIVLDHLIEDHGCRRIAYVRGPVESEEARERYEGYIDALEAHGIELAPELVETGNFWIQSGSEATERLLARGLEFDALVAANDYMALGALDALRRAGRRIPNDVLVAGFDDAPSSRTGYRSLTTVRQPLESLGRGALHAVMRMLAGERMPDRVEHDVELVTRQSCGCAYRVQAKVVSSRPPGGRQSALAELRHDSSVLKANLEAVTTFAADAFGGWSGRLLGSLADELSGIEGRFLLELEDVLEEAQAVGKPIDDFNSVIGVFRSHFLYATSGGPKKIVLDDVWHAALLLVGAAASRTHARLRTASERAQDELRQGIERLSTAFEHDTLRGALCEVLAAVNVPGACLSQYDEKQRNTLRCLFAFRAGREERLSAQAFPAAELVPRGFWPDTRRFSYVLMPITFATEELGVAVLQTGAAAVVYAMLREQMGAALKGAALHRAVVEETTRRERAEHERMNTEALLARQIQTAILPVDASIPGLEWAAAMVPAYEVGGDYYDVVPTETGCWIGMGDVSGHGLMAGLVMLMIQSMVAASVSQSPRAQPSELVVALNRLLMENVRARLGRDDHASLVLIRYENGGKATFAGFHEEILIWRRDRAVWERVDTTGVWVGATAEIGHAIRDAEFSLGEGDILVLYTDGAVEAMSAAAEQFGVERLCEAVESCVDEPLGAICQAVIQRVRLWSPVQRDDISLVVAKQLRV